MSDLQKLVWFCSNLNLVRGFALNVLLFGAGHLHTGSCDAWFVFVQYCWLHFVLCVCGRSVFVNTQKSMFAAALFQVQLPAVHVLV
jgi:hypothetical protein